MKILRSIQQLKKFRAQHAGIGFVPTMGDLHVGHLSLIERARKENKTVVVSIFVNPKQFNDRNDFLRYHRNLKADFKKAKTAGAHAVFVPSETEIYPEGFQTWTTVEQLEQPLCGQNRPGHFRGVATIVLKLLNLVQPQHAYFGLKDFQQYRIIEQLVRDLHLDVKIIPCPIVREANGVALSSRNRRLSAEEMCRAAHFAKTLQGIGEMIKSGQIFSQKRVTARFLQLLHLDRKDKLDYIQLVDSQTLRPGAKNSKELLLAAAIWIGTTRLIDNVLIPCKINSSSSPVSK